MLYLCHRQHPFCFPLCMCLLYTQRVVYFPGAGDDFFQFTAVFLSCHSLYFYFAKNTINNLAETLTDILNGSLGSLLGIELDTSQFYHDLDLLNSVQDIGGATCIATTTLSPDGTMAVINLDQGLGPILTQNLIDILQNLKTSINNLHAKGIGLRT